MASEQVCIVSRVDGLSQFEVPFVDSIARTVITKSLFLNEPVVYQPSHLPAPVLTHIVFIEKEYFVVAASVTERMIPRSQAQRVRGTHEDRIAMQSPKIYRASLSSSPEPEEDYVVPFC